MGDADLDNLRQDVADTTAAIKELSNSQQAINDKLDQRDDKLDTVLRAVTRLETLAETETARCPYRELISVAANNKRRLEKAETDLTEMKIKVAGFVVLAGIALPLGVSLLSKWLGI